MQRLHVGLVGAFGVATLWVAVNALYVYLALGGDKSYRVESAAFIFAGLAALLAVTRDWTRGKTASTRLHGVHLGILAAVTAVWLIIVLPFLSLPFLSDDYGFLELYRSAGDATKAFQFFRPAFGLAFALLAYMGGGTPVVFHLVSFLLHFGSASLVFGLARRLLGSTELAIAAYAVFLLNPVQQEAVLWASGLQDLLWTFFVLAAIYVYTTERELSPVRAVCVLVLVGAGLASKETAVAAVLLLPAADWFFFGTKRRRLQLSVYGALAIELVLYLAIRQRAVGVDRTFLSAPSQYFIKQLLAMPYEIFIHPWNRIAVQIGVVVLCLSALAAVAASGAAVFRGAPGRTLFGPVAILCSILPVYTLFYVGPDLAGSRYLYFAAAGWACLVADVGGAAIMSRAGRLAFVAIVTVCLAISLQLNARPWQTAGAIVDALAVGVRQGRPASEVVREWQDRLGSHLEVRDGVPRQFEGVGLFINGYPEFLRRVSKGR